MTLAKRKKNSASGRSKVNESSKTQKISPHISENETILPGAGAAFKSLLSARFCSAIWGHVSDCDETFNYWEPSHFLLYGKGFQTWEYNPNFGLRSYTYLLMHIVPARIYANLMQPHRMLIFYFVRCLLGLFCALCETYFFKAVCKQHGKLVGALLCAFLSFSPGMFISSTAFLPSSFSMYMSLLSTGAWLNKKYELAVFTTALSTFISWPFYALIGVPLAIDMIFFHKYNAKFIKWSILSTFVILVPMVKMDSDYYGRLVIAPLNIVLYNVFSKHGSTLYGTEPFSFYFINGFLNFNLGFVFAILAPLIIIIRNLTLKQVKKKDAIFDSWLSISPFYIWFIVFTLQPHKEERFLFPVYPLICLCCAICMSSIIIILHEIKLKFHGKFLGKLAGSSFLIYSIFLIIICLGISRIFALYRGYHAPLDLYTELNEMYAEGRISSNTPVNVCVGKEWHRFPNSFFLPNDNWNLRFIKSEFRGQLPAEFSQFENATSVVHPHFNDMNLEEPTRYFNIDNCHFLVDFDNGKYTDLEPNYSQQADKWEILKSFPFLNAEKSNRFFRAFYVPYLSNWYCTYSDYNLLISKKFQLKEG